MIALDNSYKVNKTKTDNFFQPMKNSNFLQKPLECFHSRIKKQPDTIDGLTLENDNQELARFIEDNYQYFKKQNSSLELPVDASDGRTLAQLQQASSDSDFLTLKNNIECCGGEAVEAYNKKSKNKKHKMSAISDSDFMVSGMGRHQQHQSLSLSRRFTIKTKIPFAKTILQGKLQKPGKYNSLDPQAASFCPNDDKENVKNYSQKGLNMNNNLSRSLNGCHRRNNEPLQTRSMQRVLSEGNEASASGGSGCHSQSEPQQQQQQQQQPSPVQPEQLQHPPTYDAFEMFVKLFNCEKNNKNICDKQSNKFNYKIVVNSKDYDYSDNVLVNYKSDSCEKIKSLNECARGSTTAAKVDGGCGGAGGGGSGACGAPLSAPLPAVKRSTLAKSSSDQMMLLNPRDDSFVYVLNSDMNLHHSHVLVNNFVITSPPLTPKMRSPKNVNRAGGSMIEVPGSFGGFGGSGCSPNASNYLVHSQHLNDVVSLPLDMVTASPLDHFVNIKPDSELLLDLKLAPAASGANGTIGDPSSTNFIKNNLTLTSNANQGGVIKRDKCGGVRKPSVTYDINVINRSQDFNIDDMCPQQRNSYALRSGSTSSTSRFDVSNCFSFALYISTPTFFSLIPPNSRVYPCFMFVKNNK